jgi:hypothetical protein
MRKIKFPNSFRPLFAGCASVALITLAAGNVVADTHLLGSESEAVTPSKVPPLLGGASETVTPKARKVLPDSKPPIPGSRRISDGR